jgi:hypothetical protein
MAATATAATRAGTSRSASAPAPATANAAAAPPAHGGKRPASGVVGRTRAAHKPTPVTSATTSAPSAAASSSPATSRSTCQATGSVVRSRIANVGHITGDSGGSRNERDREHERSGAVVALSVHPRAHGDAERCDCRESEQQCRGDSRIAVAALALALGAQPRLGHVHVASRADDLVARDRDAHPRFALLAHVDAGSANVNDQSVRDGRSLCSAADPLHRCGSTPKRAASARSAIARASSLPRRRAGAGFGQRVPHLSGRAARLDRDAPLFGARRNIAVEHRVADSHSGGARYEPTSAR